MKYFLFLLGLFFPVFVCATEIDSSNYVMFNLNDDSVILDKDSNDRVSVASLTKIVTAMVAIDNIDNLSEVVKIPKEGLIGLNEANASVAGFRVGQSVTYMDLLYGLILSSGADAAQTLAYYVAGGNDGFVSLMNEFVLDNELTDTHFENTTGLYDKDQYSSVYDMGIILKLCLENDTFREIFTEDTHLSSDVSITMKSTFSKMLDRYDLENDYILGAKAGYIREAGYCLASLGKYNDMEYILITVGASSSYDVVNDQLNIYKDVVNTYEYVDVFNKDDIVYTVDAVNSHELQYNIRASESFSFYTDRDVKKSEFVYKYIGDEISYSTKKGTVGIIEVYYKDRLIKSMDVMYDGSLSMRYFELFTSIVLISLMVIGIGIIIKKLILRKIA